MSPWVLLMKGRNNSCNSCPQLLEDYRKQRSLQDCVPGMLEEEEKGAQDRGGAGGGRRNLLGPSASACGMLIIPPDW